MSSYRLRRDGLACSDLGSEIVILDLDTSSYFAASASAAILVGALIEGATTADLVDCLREQYEVPTDVAAADVEAFLAQMRRRNLLDTTAPC